MNPPDTLTDGTVLLRALRLEDAAEHLAGQDIEQVRGFEFPGFARIEHDRGDRAVAPRLGDGQGSAQLGHLSASWTGMSRRSPSLDV